MELPSTPSNEEFETSKLLLEKIKGETFEKSFSREANNFKVEIFKPKEGYAAVVTEKDDDGTIRKQSVFTEEKGLIPMLNNTIDNEDSKIPEEGKIADIKDDGLIISTPESYIIVPESGDVDITSRS